MTMPSTPDLFQALEKTWPAACNTTLGPWTIRKGRGGGKRVSAATAEGPSEPADILAAETAMIALDQPPLFMIRPDENRLDHELAARGYQAIDPVSFYVCPISTLTRTPVEPVTGFLVWPPLEIMKTLWADGGITSGRLAVMHRASSPKTGILARGADRASGCAFISIYNQIAIIHGIEVALTQRRSGVGINILRCAAHWAQNQGALYFSLVVTDANVAANGLYRKSGMSVAARYHYRIRQK